VGNARLDSSRMQPLIRLKDGLHIAGLVPVFGGVAGRNVYLLAGDLSGYLALAGLKFLGLGK